MTLNKIKCPICIELHFSNTLREFVNSTSLFRHLMDEHTDHAVSSYLARKIFKINENINEYDQDWHTVKVLKSLLDNKK